MKVLVTGHLGYLGSVLVPMLRGAGHEVAGLDSELYRGSGFHAPDPVPSLRLDIRDVEPAQLAGFEAVVHLAGISNDPLGALNAATTAAVNHAGAVRVAQAARSAGVARFVFASTCSVYGERGDRLVDEEARPMPRTSYAEAKARAEEEIRALATDQFAPTALRLATLYGLSPMLRADLVLNNLVGYAVATGQVLLKSAGTSWRPLLHVEDAAMIIAAVLRAPAAGLRGAVLNAGFDEGNCRVRAVAEAAMRAVPGSRIVYADGAVPDPRSYRVSFARLGALLPGLAPSWDIARGARQLAEAYSRHGLTVAQLEGGTFQRLPRVRELIASGVVDETLAVRASDSEAASR